MPILEGVLRCKAAHKVKLYAAMLILQLACAGMYVLSSATLKDGMNQNVLTVYRNVFAAAAIAPFALYFERNRRPSITPVVFLKMIALAMLEPVLQQHLYYIGMKWTSASFASAMENAGPAVTFVMALAFGKEKLEIRGREGKAKATGTVLTVVGTVLMVLYKGPSLEFLRLSDERKHQNSEVHGSSSWTKGSLMLMGSCCCWAAFLILQIMRDASKHDLL
ncbi:hypothetical protein HPP92_003795 [Vanilla planifolia]|uniref:WAT1-related protein n=1 Tax=Vanilla planifolia TaxID=51239 RepID=A0A835VNV5_VANPL|nr:hypothetical protein HPP92_003795 [Vanilla planifolia]